MDMLQSATRLPLLTRAEEQSLGRRVKYHDDPLAAEKLVLHNVRLAISLARKWQNRGVPLEDLMQEGMVGLGKASRKFDPDKGFKFSTYATWWINHFLQRAVHSTGSQIRTPAQVTATRIALEEASRAKPGASMEELAAAVDTTVQKAWEALSASRVVASLDTAGDESRALLDTVADPSSASPEGEFFTDERVTDALAELDLVPRRIIEWRYGIGGPERKRSEIAESLGIKEAQVDAQQRDAFKKLRELLADMRPQQRAPERAVIAGPEPRDIICSRTVPA